MSFIKVVSKLRRPRNIFYFLILLFVVYIVINQFFMNWLTVTEDKAIAHKLNQDAIQQIALINERLQNLQNSIDKSNENAKALNTLIEDVKIIDSPIKLDTTTIASRNHSGKIGVLVFSCNRPGAIKNHLDQLIEARQATVDVDKFPIIVSQDCGHKPTTEVIEKYSANLFDFIKQPDLSDIEYDKSQKNGKKLPAHLRGYFKIARHYKWALDEVFMKHGFETVILNEDDLNISPDFFSYFEAMQKVLAKDSSLFCVSAWNDNGKQTLINSNDIDKVHRSDFFPGLGWMMQRSVWLEYRRKWPYGYWDDWVREPVNRKDRACLRPEISRTEMSKSEAKKGVSGGQFLDKFLKLIVMNHIQLDWSTIDTSYLLQKNYDDAFISDVYVNSKEITYENYLKKKETVKDAKLLILYSSKDEFVKYAKFFGLMFDFKAGVARTAYKGVVQLYFKTEIIYLAPKEKLNWKGYPKGW